MSNDQIPNPGSLAAIRAGCICDTWDNNENIRLVPGKGLVFSLHDMCPLHGIGTEYYAVHIEHEEQAMYDKQVSVTLTQAAWQQIVNLLDQERNVVKAMPRDSGPLGAVLNYMQDGILAGMTNTIDSICQQAGVAPGQRVE